MLLCAALIRLYQQMFTDYVNRFTDRIKQMQKYHLIRSNLPLKKLSFPNAFIGDPDFKDFKDWIPDYYLGNDRI